MKAYDWNEFLDSAQELHRQGDLDEAEKRYNVILNRNMNEPGILYLLGSLQMEREKNGLGALLLTQSLKQRSFPEAWNNLGICYKREFMKEQAAACFAKAWEMNPQVADYPSNWAGCYINEGVPDKAVELCNKALEVDPNHVQARWHMGLALLEQQKWTPGWGYYEARLEDGSGCGTATRNYADEGMTPWWDGKSRGLVAVHGEQGLGDEIMFATCLKEASETGAEIVFECAPRMHDLMKRSLPCTVHGTHRLDGQEWRKGRKVDYKLGLGSLGALFRPDEDSFKGEPYLIPNLKLAKNYRKRLNSLGQKPKIGIAWQGGVPVTRIDLRTIRMNDLLPIVSQDATFISLQYTMAAREEVAALKQSTGINILHWKEAAEAQNMDEYAALVSNLDLVISVCQTAVHVSGGLGVPCWCLTPTAPAWRYGVTGNMPWYNSVDLIRQETTWKALCEQVGARLQDYLAQRQAA